MPRPRKTAASKSTDAKAYAHPDADLAARPEIGTQAHFKKAQPPARYRFDSALAPELRWDGENGAREFTEALIEGLEAAADALAAAQDAVARENALASARRATMGNLPQRAHFLLTAIVRLNDLWMSAVPHKWTDFLEMVAEFLDQHQVLYTRDVSIPGRTVEHEVDFVIPLPKRRERLVKVIADPKPQTAKVISFTWMELQQTRPDAERVVILNDVRPPDPLSEENAEEFRRVSDQTISILRGYSSAVYRWSERSRASRNRCAAFSMERHAKPLAGKHRLARTRPARYAPSACFRGSTTGSHFTSRRWPG